MYFSFKLLLLSVFFVSVIDLSILEKSYNSVLKVVSFNSYGAEVTSMLQEYKNNFIRVKRNEDKNCCKVNLVYPAQYGAMFTKCSEDVIKGYEGTEHKYDPKVFKYMKTCLTFRCFYDKLDLNDEDDNVIPSEFEVLMLKISPKIVTKTTKYFAKKCAEYGNFHGQKQVIGPLGGRTCTPNTLFAFDCIFDAILANCPKEMRLYSKVCNKLIESLKHYRLEEN